MQAFWEPLSLFLASLITFFLIYFKSPLILFQQIIALLVALLLIPSRLVFTQQKQALQKLVRISLIFLSALLVQLLVLSSGGFYSPFLILFHLYTLGTSFLLNLPTAITFLTFSLLLLASSIIFDSRMSIIFREDPGTAVLYSISFLVIIPLAQFLIHTYHLKDTLLKILADHTKILTENIQIGQKREVSILRGLPELIIVTDDNLHILSVNEASEKVLGLSESSLSGLFLIDTLPLKDQAGNLINLESLSISDILSDKVTRIVKGFYLFTKDGQSQAVLIQVRPITDSQGKINQIVFMITQAHSTVGYEDEHFDLEQTMMRYKRTLADLKKVFRLSSSPKLSQQIEILSHIEEDLMTAEELVDHPIREKEVYEDIAYLCKQIVSAKAEFANSLGVSLQFSPPQEAKESTILELKEQKAMTQTPFTSEYSITIDIKWFRLLIQKLLDLSCLLVAKTNQRRVELSVGLESSSTIDIMIATSCLINDHQKQDLFTKYYGSLGSLGFLKFGSGLEGFIAKEVAARLNIPIIVEVSHHPPWVRFVLKISRQPHSI